MDESPPTADNCPYATTTTATEKTHSKLVVEITCELLEVGWLVGWLDALADQLIVKHAPSSQVSSWLTDLAKTMMSVD